MKNSLILKFKKIFIQKQTDHNEDDDLIPHVQSQIKCQEILGTYCPFLTKWLDLLLIIHKIILSEH